MKHRTRLRVSLWPMLLALSIILSALKLTGYSQIKWVWALSPIWIPMSILFAVFFVVFCIAVGCGEGERVE